MDTVKVSAGYHGPVEVGGRSGGREVTCTFGRLGLDEVAGYGGADLGVDGDATLDLGGVPHVPHTYICRDSSGATVESGFRWVESVDKPALIQQAVSRITVPSPNVSFNPRGETGFPALAGLPTWFWMDRSQYESVLSGEAAVTGLSVRAEARAKTLRFQPGDGDLGTGPVECPAPGLPWEPGAETVNPTGCAYTYRWATRPIRAPWAASTTALWEVTWTASDGTSGTLDSLLESTAPSTLDVAELQAVLGSPP